MSDMSPLLNFLVPTAYAQTTSASTSLPSSAPSSAPGADAASAQGAGYSFFLMFAVFFLFAYFFIWRPQSKRAKEQQNLLSSLAKGDEVVTTGGLLGKISKLSDAYITLSVANNVEIVIQKSSIVSVMPKGTLKTIE